MGFLDRLLGRPEQTPAPSTQSRSGAYPQDSTTGETAADRQAIARYRYLLRTAPPEQIEQAHAEAFTQLTPQQRQQVLADLSAGLPASERPASDQPADLARSATRAELRQPGFLQQRFGGGMGGGMGGGGFGTMLGGSMLGTIAGVVIGTAVADSLFGGFAGSPEESEAAGDGGGAEGDGAPAEGETSAGADGGGEDVSGGDFAGGDFGGGDFGGDFGGGFDF